jgi:hypothetical protein
MYPETGRPHESHNRSLNRVGIEDARMWGNDDRAKGLKYRLQEYISEYATSNRHFLEKVDATGQVLSRKEITMQNEQLCRNSCRILKMRTIVTGSFVFRKFLPQIVQYCSKNPQFYPPLFIVNCNCHLLQ